MKLKNCIKIRVPSNDDWKDVRCERYEKDNCFYGLTDYDVQILIGEGLGDLVECKEYPFSVIDSFGYRFEVTWQSDTWPQ